jgi:hypothetical protein
MCSVPLLVAVSDRLTFFTGSLQTAKDKVIRYKACFLMKVDSPVWRPA